MGKPRDGESPGGILPHLVYAGHGTMIERAAWSPASPLVATCGLSGGVHVWDAATGRTRGIYTGHAELVRDIAFSTDGSLLASCSEDGSVHVWEVESGVRRQEYREHRRPVVAISWSPDGCRLASADETEIHLWPVSRSAQNEGRALVFGRKHEFIFSGVCWLRDGHGLVTASEGSVQYWDGFTGEMVAERDYGNTLVTLALSPDGRRLALADDDAQVHVVDAGSGRVLLTRRLPLDASWGLAWSPDGRYLASCGYDTVQVWETDSGATCCAYAGHEGEVSSAVWSPDGRWIASTGGDGSAQVWAPDLLGRTEPAGPVDPGSLTVFAFDTEDLARRLRAARLERADPGSTDDLPAAPQAEADARGRPPGSPAA